MAVTEVVHIPDRSLVLTTNPAKYRCSCGNIHPVEWGGWTDIEPESLEGAQAYLRDREEKAPGASSHRMAQEALARMEADVNPVELVSNRVRAVLGRMEVALQFSKGDTATLAQTFHALEFAIRGDRLPDSPPWDIDADDALALVRALLPYLRAARRGR